MARSEKGTPRKLRIWLERCKPAANDRVELTTGVGGDCVTLAEWDAVEASQDATWEEHVFELSATNAEERGQTTLYTVRHRRGERQLGQYELKCKANDVEPGADFDGSQGALVQGLYRQNEKLLAHLIAQANANTAPLMKAIETWQARCMSLELERNRLADEALEMKRTISDAMRDLEAAKHGEADKFEERIGRLFMLAKSNGWL